MSEKRLLWGISVATIILCMVALGLWHLSHQSGTRLDCLQQAENGCKLYTDGKPFATLSIEVDDGQALQPFSIRLEPIQGIISPVEHASVTLVGVNEYMGINIYPLAPLNNGALGYRGVLPVCQVTEMHWNARIHLTTKQGRAHSETTFTTYREQQQNDATNSES